MEINYDLLDLVLFHLCEYPSSLLLPLSLPLFLPPAGEAGISGVWTPQAGEAALPLGSERGTPQLPQEPGQGGKTAPGVHTPGM